MELDVFTAPSEIKGLIHRHNPMMQDFGKKCCKHNVTANGVYLKPKLIAAAIRHITRSCPRHIHAHAFPAPAVIPIKRTKGGFDTGMMQSDSTFVGVAAD